MTDRTAAVQAAMEDEDFDALLVAAPPNIAYIAGFRATPHERLIALVVPREGPLRIVVPSLEEDAARSAVRADSDLLVWRDEDGPRTALATALEGAAGRVGIEKSSLTVANAELVAACLPSARLHDCDALLARLRVVKDESEIELMRRAARVVDSVVERLAAELHPGRSEAELATLVGRLTQEEGGERVAFEPIVLAGAKSALPHGHSDSTLLEEADLVIVDVGATVGGYSADITRTFVVGREPDDRQRELFELVRAAQQAGVRAATAGAATADVDRAARRVIEDAGMGDHFLHRTGHGLGLEVHEPPFLTTANEQPLMEGMVVTVEPGVYLQGYGGVRIEDDLVIRPAEAEVLTQSPIQLELPAVRGKR